MHSPHSMISEPTPCNSLPVFYGDGEGPPISSTTSSASSSNTLDGASVTTIVSVTTTGFARLPSASLISSATPTSSHTTGVILVTVLGVVSFISLLLFMFIFLRRRKRKRRNSDRESQIPEPYFQEKALFTTPSPASPVIQIQDEVEVIRDRARIEELELTVQLILSDRQQQSSMVSEIQDERPPDYTPESISIDRIGNSIIRNTS
ncbi:hypothetical protein DFS33DRAFT_1338830 [Desarmillaria ectypa]|nr:hypothetical protein DFS33DRAFT_1338830 [Desarmillaria ectypa]